MKTLQFTESEILALLNLASLAQLNMPTIPNYTPAGTAITKLQSAYADGPRSGNLTDKDENMTAREQPPFVFSKRGEDL